MTMVAGRVLYEQGEYYVGEDPEAVCREARRFTTELLSRV